MADADAKQLLFVVKPPKPVSEMTDADIDSLADQLFDKAAAAVATSASPPGPRGQVPGPTG